MLIWQIFVLKNVINRVVFICNELDIHVHKFEREGERTRTKEKVRERFVFEQDLLRSSI